MKAWIATLVMAGGLAAQPINKTYFGNQALHGFDVVTYFSGHPMPGKPEFQTRWRGAVWLFHSAENRKAFEADPLRFAPQYGGYCAYAMAKGSYADVDPMIWKILNGKLYLNYDRDIESQWESRQTEFIKAADQFWASQH